MEGGQPQLYTYKFWLLCISSFFFFSSFNLIIPELPDYLTSLGGGEHKGLIIPLFTLMAGFSRPFSGRLTDTIGRMPIMIYGVIVCIIAGFLYPLLTTVIGFFLLRLLHGMSTGFKPTATSAYVGDISPILRRGEAMGILGTFGSLGSSAGNAVSHLITANYGYNMLFYSSSILALLSIIIVIRMPETLQHRRKFEWRLLKLKWVGVYEPRAFPSSFVMLLVSFSFGTVLTIIPDFSKYLGIENKGLFLTVFTISSILTRILAGTLSDKYGRVSVLIGGAIIYGLSMMLLGFSISIWSFYSGAFLAGIGSGICVPTIFAWTIDLADDKYRGRALSTMFIAMEAGIGVGGVVSGYSYANNPDNFPISFTISAILTFIAAIYLLWYRKNHRKVSLA